MSITTSNRSWIAYGLLGALLAVTLAGALLLVPQNCWDGRFFLSTGMLLFAEAQLVIVAVLPRARGTVPWASAQITVSVLYLLVVIFLAWFGLSDVSLKGLGVWHLAAFFGLLLGLGTTALASGHTQMSKAALVERQVWLPGWMERFERLSNRIGLLPAGEIAALKQAFASLRDDLRYTDRDSLPGIEAIEAELDAALDALFGRTEALQSAVASADAGQIAALDGEFKTRLQQLRGAFDRRSAKLKTLR